MGVAVTRDAILLPFVGMMLLTLVVWVEMYRRRIRFLKGEDVDLATVDTPDKAAAVIPTDVSLPAHNLKNLFELPVLFYAAALFLYVSDSVDASYLAAAWLFFALRTAHSLIQCSYNTVMHRFAVYMLSSLALWWIVLRIGWQLVSGA